jgi:hypothetical protein
VTHSALFHLRPGWAETIEEAERMFAEAGIEVRSFSGAVGGCEILFNGERVSP